MIRYMKGSFVLGTYDKGTQSGQNWYIEDKSKGSSLRVTPPPSPSSQIKLYMYSMPPTLLGLRHACIQHCNNDVAEENLVE